jgi:hypothetical protein
MALIQVSFLGLSFADSRKGALIQVASNSINKQNRFPAAAGF